MIVPVFVSSFPTSYAVYAVADGDTLYIADASDGVLIVDIGDPLNPDLLSSYPISSGVGTIELEGDFIFLAGGTTGLQIFNVQDARNPIHLANGTIDPIESAVDLRVEGEYVYVACYKGFRIFKF